MIRSPHGDSMSEFDPRTVPVIINCRDRVTDLMALVDWLENAGHENIQLFDNDSTYEPLLAYYELTPHEVVRLGDNYGSRSIWRSGRVPHEYFLYTDPDVLPTEECPQDAVAHLYELLQRYPHAKAGLGLYLEDCPPFQSLPWERTLVAESRALELGVYDSLIDTSLALYRPRTAHSLFALRTGAPYQMRHLPWYHINEPTEEERFYLQRAIKGPLGSSWADGRQ